MGAFHTDTNITFTFFYLCLGEGTHEVSDWTDILYILYLTRLYLDWTNQQQPSSELGTGALPVGCIANVVMHVGESEGGLVPLSAIKKAHLGGGIP